MNHSPCVSYLLLKVLPLILGRSVGYRDCDLVDRRTVEGLVVISARSRCELGASAFVDDDLYILVLALKAAYKLDRVDLPYLEKC